MPITIPMPMGHATHDDVKRQIFVAPSPHFSWRLIHCEIHQLDLLKGI